MQAVDTNVLLRALIDDPSAPEQCAAASAWLAAQDEIFVSQIVQAELVWWLRKSPAVNRAESGLILHGLHVHPAVKLQNPDAYEAALAHFDAGGDFADGLIVFEAHRFHSSLTTFDKALARQPGVQLLAIP
jgi:predicted nucleic-acid-binding protein